MLLLSIGFGFIALCVAAWLMLFPGARELCMAVAGRFVRQGGHAAGVLGTRAQALAAVPVRQTASTLRDIGGRTARNRGLIVLTIALLVTPPLLILSLRERPQLEMFDEAVVDATQSQVLTLLRGERLAPPPDLPPEIFVAAEATLLQIAPGVHVPQRIVSADRRWERIDAEFQQRVLAVYEVMKTRYGIEMALVEGYRSPERQAELARAGKATRASAGMSCHQYGMAVDSAPLRNGRLQWDMNDPWTRDAYFLYGRLAKEAGLEWGGDWRSIKDFVHLEHKAPCRAARRAARAGR